jgi:signal transduction histidine kinase
MARKVIEEMKGSISLESVRGRGTCVSIMLPVAASLSETPHAHAAAASQ